MLISGELTLRIIPGTMCTMLLNVLQPHFCCLSYTVAMSVRMSQLNEYCRINNLVYWSILLKGY